MKSLTDKIYEGFFKNVGATRPKPTTSEELRKLIGEEIAKHGNECNLNFIDTSLITDMRCLFMSSEFNGDISEWDVSKVKNMELMFSHSTFNGDISKWNVSKVKNMRMMFSHSAFNGDISEWNVSKVKDMDYMFSYAQFNQDLSKWDINAIYISNIFYGCPIKYEFRPKGIV